MHLNGSAAQEVSLWCMQCLAFSFCRDWPTGQPFALSALRLGCLASSESAAHCSVGSEAELLRRFTPSTQTWRRAGRGCMGSEGAEGS